MKRVNLRGDVEHVCFVESDTKLDTEYEIGRKAGQLACACLGYVFNKEVPKTCKHLDAYAAAAVFGGRTKDTVSVTWNPLPASKGPKETFTFKRGFAFGGVPVGSKP